MGTKRESREQGGRRPKRRKILPSPGGQLASTPQGQVYPDGQFPLFFPFCFRSVRFSRIVRFLFILFASWWIVHACQFVSSLRYWGRAFVGWPVIWLLPSFSLCVSGDEGSTARTDGDAEYHAPGVRMETSPPTHHPADQLALSSLFNL
jgi:hypothetical protein